MAAAKKSPKSDTLVVSLARLEEQFVAHETSDAQFFGTVNARLDSLTAAVAEIDRKLSNQKGFFAGVMFVVSGIAALIATAVSYLPFRP